MHGQRSVSDLQTALTSGMTTIYAKRCKSVDADVVVSLLNLLFGCNCIFSAVLAAVVQKNASPLGK